MVVVVVLLLLLTIFTNNWYLIISILKQIRYHYIISDNMNSSANQEKLKTSQTLLTILPILVPARLTLLSHAFLPRFDPMGVFCNVNPELVPRGLTVPNAVGKAGVLPNRLLLVVQTAPKPPTSYSDY